MDTIRDTVKRSEAEIEGAQYKDIDIRYRKQVVESKTTDMIVSDLEKYHKVSVCV